MKNIFFRMCSQSHKINKIKISIMNRILISNANISASMHTESSQISDMSMSLKQWAIHETSKPPQKPLRRRSLLSHQSSDCESDLPPKCPIRKSESDTMSITSEESNCVDDHNIRSLKRQSQSTPRINREDCLIGMEISF